jgi:hypothetical protein
MYYTLSLESKKKIFQNFGISRPLSRLEKDCCDSQFFEILLQELKR